MKHKSYRKILAIENHIMKQGELTLNVKLVLWCTIDSTTIRTIKTKHIAWTCYINGSRSTLGIAARFPRKPISIKLNDPLNSTCFKDATYSHKSFRDNSYSDALKSHLDTIKDNKGIVRWFDRLSGEGVVYNKTTDTTHHVYVCNLIGAKTGYPETACVYLLKGSEVTFQLNDGFVTGIPGIFDEEAWNKLDHSKLAFKKDENGNFINGLFA